MDESYMWQRLGKRLLTGAFVLVLTACGGGGSGGGAGGTTSLSNTQPPSPLATATATYALSWTAASDPNVTGYRVYYSTAPLSSGGSPGHIDTSNTAIDFKPAAYGIAAGVTLHVAVSSTGTGGLESPVSGEASIVVE